MDTKLSFQFTPEDMVIIEQARSLITETEGKPTNITIIRKALRKFVKSYPKKRD